MPDGETPDLGAPTWSLHLPQFEGPLDLLLSLCQKHELNVLDIPIGFVTEKYLEHLAVMQLMQLELAAEYLVMAATLAHIKSKMLLPVVPSEQEEDEDASEDEVDPREALIRRLLEYQKYKLAAEQLVARGVAGRDVFPRGMPVEEAVHRGLPPLAEVPLFSLVDAFQRVLDRSKIKLTHDIVADRISITDRIGELADLLAKQTRFAFEDLFEERMTRFDLVITFLALLEMSRLKMTRLLQTEPLGPLYVELATATPPADPAVEREHREGKAPPPDEPHNDNERPDDSSLGEPHDGNERTENSPSGDDRGPNECPGEGHPSDDGRDEDEEESW